MIACQGNELWLQNTDRPLGIDIVITGGPWAKFNIEDNSSARCVITQDIKKIKFWI